MLAKEFNIIFGINKNSSSADKKEDSIIDTQWDFPEKIFSQLLGKSYKRTKREKNKRQWKQRGKEKKWKKIECK